MPIYEYQCDACGHVLDALQKIGDTPLKKCPDCGKPKLKRLLSAPMFLLKGTGWYETDFKGDKERKRNLADRPDKEAAAGDAKKEDSPAKTDKAAEKASDGAGKDAKPVDKAADSGVKETKPAASASARRSGRTARAPTTRKARPASRARRRH